MTDERQPLSKLAKVAISLFVVVHGLAVLLPPLSFQTRGPLGASPSIATLFEPLQGYSQFLYMDRGYAFFAPDPGPSHLIQAAITQPNGQQTELVFPDLQHQWPRLLYHRHFMLAEFMEEIYEPPGPPQELAEREPELARRWQQSRARYEYMRQSVVDHLKHEYPGSDVAIRRLEHLIPGVLEYQEEPIALNDPRLYQVLVDQPLDIDLEGNLAAPMGPPEDIPAPAAVETDRGETDRGETDRGETDRGETDRGETGVADDGTELDAADREPIEAAESLEEADRPAEVSP